MPDNRDRPMGFIPVRKLDGSKIPTMRFKITTSTGDIGVGDVLKKVAAGGVDIASDGDGPLKVGVVEQLQDSNGIAIGSHGSSVSTKYLPSGGSGYAICALLTPDALFRIQSSAATVEADIWQHADTTTGGASTTTGRSQTELDHSSQASSLKELVILGKIDEPGNAWGTNVDLLVAFSESAWTGDNANAGI